MEKKTKAKLVSAIIGSVVLLGVSVGTTYALFSTEKTITNHLTIGGGLKAGLYLQSLVQDKIDASTGLIAESTADLSQYVTSDGTSCYDSDKKAVDLAKYDGEIFNNIVIAPTMKGSATLRLYNLGDLAFTYQVNTTKTAYDKDGNVDADAKALDQIVFDFDYTLATVEKGKYTDIVVSYEFLDTNENNEAMNQSIALDLVINTTQITRA